MKKTVQIILALLIVVIVGLMGYRFYSLWHNYRRSQTKADISSEYVAPIQRQDTSFATISYVGLPPANIPSDLPLLDITAAQNEQLIDAVSNYCQIFEFNTEDPEYIMGYGANCDLTIEAIDGSTWIQLSPINVDAGGSFALNASTALAQEFIDQFYTNLSAVNNKTALLICDDFDCEQDDTGEYSANGAYITFSPQYQSIPIIERSEITSEVQVLVKNDQIFKAELNTHVLTAQAQSQLYPVLSLEQALQNIAAGDGVLLNYFELAGGTVEEWDIKKLDNVSFNDASLEYRLNDDNTQAIPMYHLTGNGTDIYGNAIQIAVLTPAIQFTLTP